MQIKDLTQEEIKRIYSSIDDYLSAKEVKWTKFADFGCKTVRIISYSDEFLPLVEKQLTYVLKDSAESFDDTLIIWNEKDVLALNKKLIANFPKLERKFRFEIAFRKAKKVSLDDLYDSQIFEESFSKTKPVIDIQTNRGFFIANNKEEHTYYYGVNNLEPEEFIKEGHIFVQFFNNILKTETSQLVHGAVIGLNGNGICFCARGQRGKSTLSVLSMMKGFEYVSDDYLILHQNEKNQLLSSPIYSIITLSPVMYNRLYDNMKGCQFVSNNARKDKYVFNIANFHSQFKGNYPIKLCIFPEIVSDKDPSIKLCTVEEKGRAIVQMIQSTLMQTQDMCENWTVKKMMNMIKDLPFYKLNLCWDIDRNTEFLRDFMNKFETLENKIVETPKIGIDITFDLANILNTETGIIYYMNKFATNIFENLLAGVSVSDILKELEHVEKDLNLFIEALEAKGIFKQTELSGKQPFINKEFAQEDNYKLSFVECAENEYMELIKENRNELCIK